jgi:hypothetical protein
MNLFLKRVVRCWPIMALFGFGLVPMKALGAGTSEDKKAAAEPAIELPKVVVTDSRDLPPPESWRYATIPGFEILSNASDKATLNLIKDFEEFQQALHYVWQVPNQMNTPILLVFCGRGAKFDKFIPANTEGSAETARASVFLNGRSQTAIVIDVESSVLTILSADIDDPAMGTDSSQFSVEHNKELYRQYVHYLLSRGQPRLPAWFEEGLSQIIMAMKFDKRYIEYAALEDANTISAQAGMVNDLNAAAAAAADPEDPTATDLLAGAPVEDKDFNAVLPKRAIIPMAKFFSVTHDSPEALNPLGNNTWSKQAYAFVHMGLYGTEGGKPLWQKQFSQFLMRSMREPVTEQMFKECWGMSYKDMQMQIRLYSTSPRFEIRRMEAKKGEPDILKVTNVVLQEATPAQVGRIKGETFLLGGHKDAARTELTTAYLRGEKDPDLLAALGVFELTDGKADHARKLLDAAAPGHPKNPDALVELAKMRLSEALAAPGGPNGQLSDAQVVGITPLLLDARMLPPLSPTAYDLLAQTWALSSVKPQREDLKPLIDGVRLFPTRYRLVLTVATVAANAGLYDAAKPLTEHGLKYATDPALKAQFEKLSASLPPVATTAVAPGNPGPAPVPTAK